MNTKIPTTISLLSFVLVGTACTSDARKVARASEKVCKAQCECDGDEGYWDSVKTCKDACVAYADLEEVYMEMIFEQAEPCKDLGKLTKKLGACAKESCGEIEECAYGVYPELSECIGVSTYYYYDGYQAAAPSPAYAAQAIRQELTAQLLYAPGPLDCDAVEDRSPLCDALGKTSE